MRVEVRTPGVLEAAAHLGEAEDDERHEDRADEIGEEAVEPGGSENLGREPEDPRADDGVEDQQKTNQPGSLKRSKRRMARTSPSLVVYCGRTGVADGMRREFPRPKVTPRACGRVSARS